MHPDALRVSQIRQAGFLLALCLLAAVGGAAVWSYQGAVSSFDWVEHTHGVMSSIQAYRADLRSAESAARGYRLSRRPGMRDDAAAALLAQADFALNRAKSEGRNRVVITQRSHTPSATPAA